MKKGSSTVTEKITHLRAKQKTLEERWSKTGNPSLLQFFIDTVPDLLNSERCSIFIFNPTSDALWLYCGTDILEGQIRVPRIRSMAGQALSSGHYKVVTNMEEKAGIHEAIDGNTGFTTCNTLSIPIFNLAQDQAIGVLQILNKRGAGSFTHKDITLMQRLSSEISRFVESIFKHQEIAEILVKIRKKIKGLENFQAKKGIQKRQDQETMIVKTTQARGDYPWRLH
ncbi:MAG: GAF domain-containing protein [Gammaproteobacteria bacterium]|nr:GAF domain-containing protein [Gammaproteobacteria bacterium]